MIEQLDPLANDQLAMRLDRLAIAIPPAPEFARLSSDHLRRPNGRLRAWRAPAAGIAAALAAALTVTAMAYPGGLGGLTQDMLKAAGLQNSQVQPLTGLGEAAGVRVSINGGYGDSLSTVLFVSINTPCVSGPCSAGIANTPYLIDQFGTRYDTTSGYGLGVGYYPIFFNPLNGGARSHGGRLTLHLPIWTQSGHGSGEVVVPISGTLSPGSGHELQAPAPVVDSSKGVTYSLTALAISGNYLEAHTRITGNLNSIIVHFQSGGMSGQSWPGVFLVDPSGKWSSPLAGGAERPTIDTSVQDETRVFAIHGPGMYHLVVATSADNNSVPGHRWTTLASWVISIP
jgi:hypothetical protein